LYSYVETLKKHGLKLTLAIFLGNLVTSFLFTGVVIFLAIIGVLSIALGGVQFKDAVYDIVDVFDNGMFTVRGWSDIFTLLSSSDSLPIAMLLLSFALLIFLLLLAVSFAISAFQTAGSTVVTKEAILENRVDIGSFFTKGFQFTGKMFGVLLLSSLPYLLSIGLFIIPAMFLCFLRDTEAILGGVLLLFIGLVLTIVIAVALMHAPIILIMEKTGIFQAILLSFTLFRKAFVRVLGSAFYSFLISMASSILTGILLLSLFVQPMLSVIPTLIQLIISSMVTMLTLLLIIYRYHRYLRTYIHTETTGQPTTHAENAELPTVLNDSSTSNLNDSPPIQQ
jgi:hypothetical protein